ncbi:MAG: tol-pal system protein YbgF [Burkholderiaceae bacterium]|nr:tol-pal system protein YbgF [Polynucleobacter sp.]NCA10098.1 tol-pal system protein YbgF [Burkholderiaceae bacterium]NCV72547.1 tol-pal system protein YbgF [Burkholderiaceae bacterium]NCV78655.1 tol-pal system protein YbgF [Burkholderiaceae bacterium]NCX66941.1 tol-pal system protein YbgF [Burkholderiaceae bacterium]
MRKSVQASQGAILDLQNQIEKLRTENAQLRGQIESLQKQTDDLTKNQKTYYQDLDNRLTRFEPQTIEVEGVTGVVQAGERSAYEEALNAFQNNQVKKADSDLTAFIRKYPSSPYLPLALFWSGNTKYALKDYNGSINQLQTLITRFPGHQRVPAAMLTLGNANLESGKKAVAKKVLSDLIAKYPDSEAAKEAKPIVANIK